MIPLLGLTKIRALNKTLTSDTRTQAASPKERQSVFSLELLKSVSADAERFSCCQVKEHYQPFKRQNTILKSTNSVQNDAAETSTVVVC